MERRESEDTDKKLVRIRLKTDPKPDPRSVKAEGKTALKKDDISSPDSSTTSQQRDSQQRYSDGSTKRVSEEQAHTQDETKIIISKDQAETLSNRIENVVDRNFPSSNLENSTGSTKLNVKNDQEEAIKSKHESTEYKDKVGITKNNDISLGKTIKEELVQDGSKNKEKSESVPIQRFSSSMLVTQSGTAISESIRSLEETQVKSKSLPSKPDALNQEGTFSKDQASSQNSNSTKAPKETSIVLNDKINTITDGKILNPLSSIIEEDHVGTSNNPIEIKSQVDNEIIVSNVQVDDTADTPSTKISIKLGNKTNKDLNESTIAGEGDNTEGTTAEIMRDNYDINHVNSTKEENLSKPFSSNKEEDHVSTSNNENERSDLKEKSRSSGNDDYETNYDDPLRRNTSETKEQVEKGMIVSTVHNDEDTLDTISTKTSTKLKNKTNENLDDDRKRTTDNYDIIQSDVTTTTNSNSIVMIASTAQSPDVEHDPPTAKGMNTNKMETNPEETQNNSGDELHRDKNSIEGNKDSSKKDPHKRGGRNGSARDLLITLKRTSGSEDLKINELKDKVRHEKVFVVRGDPGCYSVRWAAKRKVLAYKVGSRNTSRFSTVLIDTVEQLERASVRHPSIISELTHPTTGAKGSLLSTYFAGADARRSIKDNLIREAGTNTDHQNQLQPRQESPDYNFFAKDHISPEGEVFGGVVLNQRTTAEPIIESNNYNYPYLTDYDVNHERKAK